MRRVLTILIRIYQCTISPLLGPCCRFYPSCSQYCLEAVQVHGCLRGLLLGIKRILKCHPFHPGGVDPVPDRRSRDTAQGARTNAGPETVNTAENGTNGHG